MTEDEYLKYNYDLTNAIPGLSAEEKERFFRNRARARNPPISPKKVDDFLSKNPF